MQASKILRSVPEGDLNEPAVRRTLRVREYYLWGCVIQARGLLAMRSSEVVI